MATLKLYTAFAAAPLLGLMSNTATAQTTLVEHNFSGNASTLLDGTTIDTYDSAITTVGGSDTWKAQGLDPSGAPYEGFFADGSAAVFASNASINLGSYINDAKGSSDAIFELTGTLGEVADNFTSIGFGIDNSPTTRSGAGGGQQIFNNAGSIGVATAIYRGSGAVDYFPGEAFAEETAGSTGNTGAQTLTTTLDLRGWDGTNNFGSVTFAQNGVEATTVTFTQDHSFGSILLTVRNDLDANYSNLSLTQIPEPASFGLTAALFGLALCGARRRRK